MLCVFEDVMFPDAEPISTSQHSVTFDVWTPEICYWQVRREKHGWVRDEFSRENDQNHSICEAYINVDQQYYRTGE